MKAIQREDMEDEMIPVKNEETGDESYMELRTPVRSEQHEDWEDRAFYNTRLFLEDGTVVLAMSVDLDFIND